MPKKSTGKSSNQLGQPTQHAPIVQDATTKLSHAAAARLKKPVASQLNAAADMARELRASKSDAADFSADAPDADAARASKTRAPKKKAKPAS